MRGAGYSYPRQLQFKLDSFGRSFLGHEDARHTMAEFDLASESVRMKTNNERPSDGTLVVGS